MAPAKPKAKFQKSTKRNQFNYQWVNQEEKSKWIVAMKKEGCQTLAEFIRVLFRKYEQK